MGMMKHRTKAAVWIVLILVLIFCLQPAAVRIVQAEETEVTAASLNPDFDTVIQKVHTYIKGEDTNPGYGSVWKVIGMTRSNLGVSSSYTDTFYKNVYTYLEQNDWNITRTTYSNYSKLILALTAAGKDAQNIGGHNLFAYLSDFSNVKKQGFMGPLWALMAFRCHPDYSIPVDASVSEQTTEEGLITYLISNQVANGGWALQGDTADPDVTGMTIQALSTYYGERDDVTEAIDCAVSALATLQTDSGGYGTQDRDSIVETAESSAQVITALSSIGIDSAKDSRFINSNGNWPMMGLFRFYQSQGGFSHVMGGELNAMATEQGMYAMAAYKRMKEGKTALYDMSDITLSTGEAIAVEESETTATTTTVTKETSGVSANLAVSVSQIVLDYASVTIKKGKTKTLTAVVSPTSATNKKLKWSSSKTKVATVTQKGKVKGVKTGTTVITVKAKDGSGVSASCVVKVVAASGSSTTQSSSTTQAKTVSGTSTKSLGSSSNTKSLGTASTQSTETTEETGGWSFAGQDYVPEDTNNSDGWDTSFATTDENNTQASGWADKTITIKIPLGRIFYTGLGGILVLVIEGIIWLVIKKRKGKKIKL